MGTATTTTTLLQSLYSACDLALYKPRTDVVLVGSAFAPEHVAVTPCSPDSRSAISTSRLA